LRTGPGWIKVGEPRRLIAARSGRILISGRANRHLKPGKSTLQSAAQIAAQTHHNNPQKRPGTPRIHLYLTTTYAKLGLFVIDRSSVQVRSSAPVNYHRPFPWSFPTASWVIRSFTYRHASGLPDMPRHDGWTCPIAHARCIPAQFD